jgi:hypothetical protein
MGLMSGNEQKNKPERWRIIWGMWLKGSRWLFINLTVRVGFIPFLAGWKFADGVAMMAVTLGRKKATGRSGGLKIPGFVVWFVSESSSFRMKSKEGC